MSQTTTFHIPVVFDVSGGATLFAEEKPDDFVENHLQFTLDARTNAYGYTSLLLISLTLSILLIEIAATHYSTNLLKKVELF